MHKENYRYLARFVVETSTPLAIGSGVKGLTVDRIIARDYNQMPYIPASSLAGVIRHELSDNLGEDFVDEVFGYHGSSGGQGSRINFSSAMLLAEDGKSILEGLQDLNLKEGYYSYFNRLPERDHVRITDRGAADTEGHGKFDEELVHKGTRFVFEIEMEGKEEDSNNWEKILNILYHPAFRIGAGTRKGFGKLKVIECKTKVINLDTNIKDYLSIPGTLNKDVSKWSDYTANDLFDSNYYHYKVELKPESFYLFGAGIGDADVDMAPKTEKFFDWTGEKPQLSQEKILIPASSVKGALSHRVAYWYNKNNTDKKITADQYIAEFNDLDLQSFLRSLSGLNEINKEVKSISEAGLKAQYSFDSLEKQDLEELKNEFENKKKEALALLTKLRSFNVEEDLVSSNVWKDYKEGLEDQLSVFKELNPNVSEMNEAVRELFGYAKDSKISDGLRGRVILSDVYIDRKEDDEKIFDHVAIDRFTGGGIDGALYQEKAIASDDFAMDLFVEVDAFKNDHVKQAFEQALNDLVSGQLQLGGNTGKGHGAFIGKYNLVK